MTAGLAPGALTRACAQVRAAGPDDAVAGVVPRFVARPGDVTEAAAVLRAAAAEGLTAVPRGAGTRLAWGSTPARCDLVVDTRGLNRVLEHAAGDLVVRVQAGVGMDQLAQVLAAAGQRLALDPPPPAHPPGPLHSPFTGNGTPGTVGGVLATGVAGPLRLRYGTPRDLAIGITVVRADGTVASSGGKVVKNVAGYDLGKLFAGSYGTLGLIVEAAFRLHPLPGATSFVTLDAADAASAYAVVAAAASSPLAPSAAEIDRPARPAPIRVGILLEGDPDGVAERSARMAELLGGVAAESPVPPDWWGRGAAAAGDGTVIRIAFWAAALAEVLGAIDAAASAAGLDPAVSGSAAAGVIYAAVDESAAPAAVSRFVTGLRTVLAGSAPAPPAPATAPSPAGAPSAGPVSPADVPPSRATAVVLHAPAEVRAAVDLWGPVPALGLMRAVKDQFDPEHRMAPGRFAGGI
jgi:glycolate oxidase FAD binding subunit